MTIRTVTAPIFTAAAWVMFTACIEPDLVEDEAPALGSRSCPASLEDAWMAADDEVVATGAAKVQAAAARALAGTDTRTPEDAAAAAWAELDPCTLEPTAEGLALLTEVPNEVAPGYEPQSYYGDGCRVACAMAGFAGCRNIMIACTGATVITLGRVAIPCGWAISAGCLASVGGGALCSGRCPK